MAVIQGEQFNLPIRIMFNGKPIDDSVDSMSINIGGTVKSTPQLSYHRGCWMYPLTSEETEEWSTGYRDIQATWTKGNTIRKTPVSSISILAMLGDSDE